MARTKQYFSTTCFKKSTKPRSGVTLSDKSDKIFDLTGKKKVSVMKFNGLIYVDLREYYENKEGVMKPTKKGMSLTIQNWEDFKKFTSEIDNSIKLIQKDDNEI